jgi:hypothetical protein
MKIMNKNRILFNKMEQLYRRANRPPTRLQKLATFPFTAFRETSFKPSPLILYKKSPRLV